MCSMCLSGYSLYIVSMYLAGIMTIFTVIYSYCMIAVLFMPLCCRIRAFIACGGMLVPLYDWGGIWIILLSPLYCIA